MFSAMIFPFIGAMLATLIPVGPEVAVSSVSAPFWEMVFASTMLSLKTTGGAPGTEA